MWQQRTGGDDAAKKLKSIKKDTDHLLRQVDETAKNSYNALGKVNEEELRELYKFLIEKEGTSQAEIHRKLQHEVDWWKSVGNHNKWKSGESKSRGKRTKSVDATADSSDDDTSQATEAGDMALGNSSEDDDEVQSRPGELPVGESLEHDEGQHGGLGDWLFQSKEYLEWKKYPQGLLWLYGDCKSLVASYPKGSGCFLRRLTRGVYSRLWEIASVVSWHQTHFSGQGR